MLARRVAYALLGIGIAACSFKERRFEPPTGSGGLVGIGGQIAGSGGTVGGLGGDPGGAAGEPGSGGTGGSGGSPTGGPGGTGGSGGIGGGGGDPGGSGGTGGGSGGMSGAGGAGGTGGSPLRSEGEACVRDAQCQSAHCRGRHCVPAQCEDGTSNGDETGVDCGGSTCARCPSSAACSDNSDCTSEMCNGSCQEQLQILCACPVGGCANETNSLVVRFKVRNVSTMNLSLQDLSVRYYFNSDGLNEMSVLECAEAGLTGGCGAVNRGLESLDLEGESAIVMTLLNHNLVGINETGEIRIELSSESGEHVFFQDDDYSYQLLAADFEPCQRMTLHAPNGEVLWGIEPRKDVQ